MEWFYDFLDGFINGLVSLGDWFITPIFLDLSPLALVSITGLLVFLGVAVVKWLLI